MSRSRTWSAMALALVLLLTTSVPAGLGTHQTGEKFRNYPYSGYANMVWWDFDGFPTNSSYRLRVEGGAYNWNLAKANLHFSRPPVYQWNVHVAWTDITFPFADNALGMTIVQGCLTPPDRLCLATLWLDSQTNWYAGTGTPGGTQYDMQSVAAHEWGHVVQMLHEFSNSSYLLYPTISAGQKKRCPVAHERDNVRTMYGTVGAYQACLA